MKEITRGRKKRVRRVCDNCAVKIRRGNCVLVKKGRWKCREGFHLILVV